MEKEKKQEKEEGRDGGEGAVDSCHSDKVMDHLGLLSSNKDSELLVRS